MQCCGSPIFDQTSNTSMTSRDKKQKQNNPNNPDRVQLDKNWGSENWTKGKNQNQCDLDLDLEHTKSGSRL